MNGCIWRTPDGRIAIRKNAADRWFSLGGSGGVKEKPGGEVPTPGYGVKRVLLSISPASCRGDSLAAQGLTLFATTILARFFVAFFQLQALEEAIVLDLFFQNPHGFFEIVIENLDFNCFQTGSTPLFPIACSGCLALFQP